MSLAFELEGKLKYFERLVNSTQARFCKPTAGLHPQFTGPYCGVIQINSLLDWSEAAIHEANRRVQKNIDLALAHQGMETRTFRYVFLMIVLFTFVCYSYYKLLDYFLLTCLTLSMTLHNLRPSPLTHSMQNYGWSHEDPGMAAKWGGRKID